MTPVRHDHPRKGDNGGEPPPAGGGTTPHPPKGPTPVKPHTRSRRVGAVAALALAGALSLSGCGGADPGAAATVDGQVVSERDVEAVFADLNRSGVTADEVPERSSVAETLVMAPIFFRHLQGTKILPTEAQTRASLEQQVADPSAATVDFARMRGAEGAYQQLGQQAQTDPRARSELLKAQAAAQQANAEVRAKLDSGAIVFSPRYTETSNLRPNWLEPVSLDGGDGADPVAPEPAPQG